MHTQSTIFSLVLMLASAGLGSYASFVARGPGPVVICSCPADVTGATAESDTIFTSYECTYPSGACVWDAEGGGLLTVDADNCPKSAECPDGDFLKCTCPKDSTGAQGTFDGALFAYTCDYPSGKCNYNSDGDLLNPKQANCASSGGDGCDIKSPIPEPA